MKYLAISFVTIVAVALTAGAASAQASKEYSACSAKASTQIAMNACASAEATREDKELNSVYAEVLVKAAGKPEYAEKVKAAERAWVAYRDAYIEAMYPAKDKQTEYGSMYPLNVDLLRAKLTQRQALALRELLKQYSGGGENNPT
jgi:uncharacterized protein YecT (DUF1311 family)